MDKDVLKEYIRHLYSVDLKPKSIKRKLATLKSFFNYLEFEEIILGKDATSVSLQAMTGSEKVPQIFIGGKYIGGSDKLEEYLG